MSDLRSSGSKIADGHRKSSGTKDKKEVSLLVRFPTGLCKQLCTHAGCSEERFGTLVKQISYKNVKKMKVGDTAS
jgi:hypothetical protein